MSTGLKKGVLGVAVILVGMQFVPYGSAQNPPVETEVAMAPEVRQVLLRTCYDCHSNETVWPWYSRVAPAKWLVRNDVAEGRRNLNFSAWNRYDAERQAHKLEEIVEVLDTGEMPPRIYLPLHPDAELTAEEVALIRDWATQMREALIASDTLQ